MYKCMITGRNSREGDKLNHVIAATRPKTYEHWDADKEENWFTTGSEIVLELNASNAGVELWNSWTEEQRRAFLVSKKLVNP